MKRIDVISEVTTEVNRSKFIAFAVPYDQFEKQLKDLRHKHPKASHIVTAWRHLNEYDQIIEASSDDGEPRGCAGVPVLNVLRGEDLIETAILVVRYFGGTKLGTGGMVRAYTLAAKNAIAGANTKEYRKLRTMSFETEYSDNQKVEYLLSKTGISDIEREFLSGYVKWKIISNDENLENFGKMAGRILKNHNR